MERFYVKESAGYPINVKSNNGAGGGGGTPTGAPRVFVIDCAHYSEDMREDNAGFLTATCSCGWLCPPCPDEETRTDALMQHAYEAGMLTERAARG